MGKPPKKPKKPSDSCRFVTEYVHHWTKKLMRARDYGYKAWPIPVGKKNS